MRFFSRMIRIFRPWPYLSPRDGYFDNSAIKNINLIILPDQKLLFYAVSDPFALGVAIFDRKNPGKLLWRTEHPLWQSQEKIKPHQVRLLKDEIRFYFSTDKKRHFAQLSLSTLLQYTKQASPRHLFQRLAHNPILKPRSGHDWESGAVFNPAAIYINDKVHFIYRAVGELGISVLGYAASADGVHIDERLSTPAYAFNKPFTKEAHKGRFSTKLYPSGGSWCGCEDPRLTQIDDTIYMTYVAFNSWTNPQRIALTAISVDDFLAKQWNWRPIRYLSAPHQIAKNWTLFPEKIQGKYAILHSISPLIQVDYLDELDFEEDVYIESHYHSAGPEDRWDNWVRGVGPPPIKTKEGWLILYHAMDKRDPNRYKIGGMILHAQDITQILYRSPTPLLEPDAHYENDGHKAGVVYVCGAVVMDDKLFIYYGGADTVVCAAIAELNAVINFIKGLQPPQFTWVNQK